MMILRLNGIVVFVPLLLTLREVVTSMRRLLRTLTKTAKLAKKSVPIIDDTLAKINIHWKLHLSPKSKVREQ